MNTRLSFRGLALAALIVGFLVVQSTAALFVHRSASVDHPTFVVADGGTPTPQPIDCEDGLCGG